MAGIQDFRRDAMALEPLASEAWGHWVFVCWDGTALTLLEGVAELDARLKRSGWMDLPHRRSESESTTSTGCSLPTTSVSFLAEGLRGAVSSGAVR